MAPKQTPSQTIGPFFAYGLTPKDYGRHGMPLEDINKSFDLMHAGESIRSVVVY